MTHTEALQKLERIMIYLTGRAGLLPTLQHAQFSNLRALRQAETAIVGEMIQQGVI
jgi:hypothetical protein